jgi:hypothetical protein
MTYSGLVPIVSQELGEMYVSPASLERTELQQPLVAVGDLR